jgi:hypothetical protein
VVVANIVGVRELGDTSYPCWMAATHDGATLLLERGEQLLWSGNTSVKFKGAQSTVALERYKDTSVVVTDRRVAFFSTRYDMGGGYSGLHGSAIGVVADVVSKRAATKRRAGKVLIGQVRYEWVHMFGCRFVKALFGGAHFAEFYLKTGAGLQRVIVASPPKTPQESFAPWGARTIAAHRVEMEAELGLPISPRYEKYQSGHFDSGLYPKSEYDSCHFSDEGQPLEQAGQRFVAAGKAVSRRKFWTA